MFFRKKDIPMSDEKLNIDGCETGTQGTAGSQGTQDGRSVNEQPMPTVAQLRRRMHQQIFLIILSLTVAGVSTGAFISRAWFANNKEVDSSSGTITSDTPTPSLYIRPSSENDKKYADKVTRSLGATLYPISTNDLENWFYASSFTFGAYEVSESGTTIVRDEPVADGFTNAKGSITLDSKGTSGTYTNSLEGDTRTAYYYASDNLYTTSGNLDVYLNPDSPITVTLNTDVSATASDADKAKNEYFKKSLRVGLKAGDTVLIYAPEAETKSGNTTGDSSTTTYKAIESQTADPGWKLVDPSNTVNSLASYTAVKSTAGSGTYTKGTATKLCTATTTGIDVQIYVWLEGTDSAARIGLSDSDEIGVTVNVSYVGVEPDSTT